jgi:hypothetical protein
MNTPQQYRFTLYTDATTKYWEGHSYSTSYFGSLVRIDFVHRDYKDRESEVIIYGTTISIEKIYD